MKEKKSYIISYDLVEEGNYEALINHIKDYSYWAHITKSTWAILTTKSVTEVRDDILKFLTPNSRIFVVESANVAAWHNTICSNEWLKKNV